MPSYDHYAFLLKKFLGGLLMPTPLLILALLWAFMLLWKRKTRWLGMLLVLLTAVSLAGLSYAPLTQRLVEQREQSYPAWQPDPAHPVDAIIVLGARQHDSATLPLTSQISPVGIVRLTEGIRIYRQNPGSQLIFSGYSGLQGGPESYAAKLRRLALELGVPDEDIVIFEEPRDTAEEAAAIAAEFGDSQLVLVTSAAHMARALELFKAAALQPIPAPTGHSIADNQLWVFPEADNLARVEAWLHEEIGHLWAGLTGQYKKLAETAQ